MRNRNMVINVLLAVALIAMLGLALVRKNQKQEKGIEPVPTNTEPNVIKTLGFCGDGPQVPYHVEPTAEQGTYVILTRGNTDGGLLSNQIRSLEMTQEGVIVGYVGSEEMVNNLSFVSPRYIETCQSGDLHITGHINDIVFIPDTETSPKQIFVATDGHGAYLYEGGQWRNFTTLDGLPDDRLYDLVRGRNGTIYVTSWEGIAYYDPDTQSWKPLDILHNDRLPEHIHALLWQDAFVWEGTISDGIYLVHNDLAITLRAEEVTGWPSEVQVVPELHSNKIRVLFERPDTDQVIVGGDPGFALFRPSTGEWDDLSPGPRPDEYSVLDIDFDAEGQIWVTGPDGTHIIRLEADGSLSGYEVFWSGGSALEIGFGLFEGKVAIATDEGLYLGNQVSQMPDQQ